VAGPKRVDVNGSVRLSEVLRGSPQGTFGVVFVKSCCKNKIAPGIPNISAVMCSAAGNTWN
jgi:hypothetical protein